MTSIDKYPTVQCKWCDRTERLAYNDETIGRLVRLQACHSCGFWLMHIDRNAGPDADRYVVDHRYNHFLIAEENGSGFRGFGGSPFLIEWFDGREPTHTTNLWSQGEIPERWRDRFTPNARVGNGRRAVRP